MTWLYRLVNKLLKTDVFIKKKPNEPLPMNIIQMILKEFWRHVNGMKNSKSNILFIANNRKTVTLLFYGDDIYVPVLRLNIWINCVAFIFASRWRQSQQRSDLGCRRAPSASLDWCQSQWLELPPLRMPADENDKTIFFTLLKTSSYEYTS